MKNSDIFLLGGLAIIGYVIYKKMNPPVTGQGVTTAPANNPVTGLPNLGSAGNPANNLPSSGASNHSTPGPSNGQTSTNPTGAPTGPSTNPGTDPANDQGDPGDGNYDPLGSASNHDGSDPSSSQGDPGDDSSDDGSTDTDPA